MIQSKNIQKTGWRIQGMSCTSCSANIEKKLKIAKDVINASVNFAAEKAI